MHSRKKIINPYKKRLQFVSRTTNNNTSATTSTSRSTSSVSTVASTNVAYTNNGARVSSGSVSGGVRVNHNDDATTVKQNLPIKSNLMAASASAPASTGGSSLRMPQSGSTSSAVKAKVKVVNPYKKKSQLRVLGVQQRNQRQWQRHNLNISPNTSTNANTNAGIGMNTSIGTGTSTGIGTGVRTLKRNPTQIVNPYKRKRSLLDSNTNNNKNNYHNNDSININIHKNKGFNVPRYGAGAGAGAVGSRTELGTGAAAGISNPVVPKVRNPYLKKKRSFPSTNAATSVSSSSSSSPSPFAKAVAEKLTLQRKTNAQQLSHRHQVANATANREIMFGSKGGKSAEKEQVSVSAPAPAPVRAPIESERDKALLNNDQSRTISLTQYEEENQFDYGEFDYVEFDYGEFDYGTNWNDSNTSGIGSSEGQGTQSSHMSESMQKSQVQPRAQSQMQPLNKHVRSEMIDYTHPNPNPHQHPKLQKNRREQQQQYYQKERVNKSAEPYQYQHPSSEKRSTDTRTVNKTYYSRNQTRTQTRTQTTNAGMSMSMGMDKGANTSTGTTTSRALHKTHSRQGSSALVSPREVSSTLKQTPRHTRTRTNHARQDHSSNSHTAKSHNAIPFTPKISTQMYRDPTTCTKKEVISNSVTKSVYSASASTTASAKASARTRTSSTRTPSSSGNLVNNKFSCVTMSRTKMKNPYAKIGKYTKNRSTSSLTSTPHSRMLASSTITPYKSPTVDVLDSLSKNTSVEQYPQMMFLHEAIQRANNDNDANINIDDTTTRTSQRLVQIMGLIVTDPCGAKYAKPSQTKDKDKDFSSSPESKIAFCFDDGTAMIDALYEDTSSSAKHYSSNKLEMQQLLSNLGLPQPRQIKKGDTIDCIGFIQCVRSSQRNGLCFIVQSVSFFSDPNLETLRIAQIAHGQKFATKTPSDDGCKIKINRSSVNPMTPNRLTTGMYVFGNLKGRKSCPIIYEPDKVHVDLKRLMHFINLSRPRGLTFDQLESIFHFETVQEVCALRNSLKMLQTNYEIYISRTGSYLPL